MLFSFFREDGRGAGASCERNKGITTASCFVSPLPLSSSCSLLFSSISHILRAPFTLPSLFIQPLSPPFASSSFFQSSVPLLLQVSPSSTPVYLPQDFFFLFFDVQISSIKVIPLIIYLIYLLHFDAKVKEKIFELR